MGLKDKISFKENPDPRRRFVRYPDTDSPNACTVLQSLIPALTMKCVFYATTWDWMASNVNMTVYEILRLSQEMVGPHMEKEPLTVWFPGRQSTPNLVDQETRMGGRGRDTPHPPTNHRNHQGPMKDMELRGMAGGGGGSHTPHPGNPRGPPRARDEKDTRPHAHAHSSTNDNNGMLKGKTCSVRTLEPYGFFAILLMHAVVAAYTQAKFSCSKEA